MLREEVYDTDFEKRERAGVVTTVLGALDYGQEDEGKKFYCSSE
jgi:hypothetical protein